MTPSEVAKLVKKLASAKGSAEHVFGDLGAPGERADRLKELFRRYALALHPDHHPGDKKVADAMSTLTGLREKAERKIADDTYGQPDKEPVTIRTKSMLYSDVEPLSSGDIFDVFTANYLDAKAGKQKRAIIRILRDNADLDLANTESNTLRDLQAKAVDKDKPFSKYMPRVLEIAQLSMGGKQVRANILTRGNKEEHTLAEVLAAFPNGVGLRSAAWMWRRQLEIIAWVHRQGRVHGAVTPEHFLIRPEDHGGRLIDWTASVPVGDVVKYMAAGCEHYYPREVKEKRSALPATDIFMSAECMWQLIQRLPYKEVHVRVIKLLDACRLSRFARFNDAVEVYRAFDEILKDLYGPPSFHPFTMPTT